MSKDISSGRGASALVLSGELTEGVSDLSQARTAPGGVPALREVNQDRSHPDAPDIEEQPPASFRRLVSSGQPHTGGAWATTHDDYAIPEQRPPGPAQQAAQIQRDAATAQIGKEDRTTGGNNATGT
jgi:hypothetical protein